jgi:molybdopterin molybdotransferase
MISVEQAEQIILSCQRQFGVQSLPLSQALGHVLAEPVLADRDLPPFNRVAMDGIAIRFDDWEKGQRVFSISGIVAAGEPAPTALLTGACFEIMTGAALPPSADTVIPYEHLKIEGGTARVVQDIVNKGQNIHVQGNDHKQGTVLMDVGKRIGATEISVAASSGKTHLLVNKVPRVAIFSSGNELVEIHETPLPYQIRRSNNYAIKATLQQYGIEATMLHVPDDLGQITEALRQAKADFDVLVLSGGISMGKFDFIPQALESLGVEKKFHKVQQRPGKPFWFGTFGEKGVVFALPGNPVSTYLCLIRYVLPWLESTLGYPPKRPTYAVLDKELRVEAPLQFFLQVKLWQDDKAMLHASPVQNKGSGDYASLLEADGFMELPAEQTVFQAGQVFRVHLK